MRKNGTLDAYRNGHQYPDEVNARIEKDQVLDDVSIDTLQCSAELYKAFSENVSFQALAEEYVVQRSVLAKGLA